MRRAQPAPLHGLAGGFGNDDLVFVQFLRQNALDGFRVQSALNIQNDRSHRTTYLLPGSDGHTLPIL